VYLGNAEDRPLWIGEVKWSDRMVRTPEVETKGLRNLIGRHSSILSAFMTTKAFTGKLEFEECRLSILAYPTSLHCYRVGRNITSSLDVKTVTGKIEAEDQQIELFASEERDMARSSSDLSHRTDVME
jgi:hypothetical protein